MKHSYAEISRILKEEYPLPDTALNFETPFQLLIATILSAQTTDVQVNRVTDELFKKYKTPDDYAALNEEDLAEKIRSLGLFRNKSRFIIETSRRILNEYEGEVPCDFEELTTLPGVGRKTASVVMYAGFSLPAFPVDTHVFRVSNRLGLASSSDREEVEFQLRDIFPEEEWGDMHLRLIYHGRDVCSARNPDCEDCQLKEFCQHYAEKMQKNGG